MGVLRECWDHFERWGERVHFAYWIIDGIISLASGSAAGLLAQVNGWQWLLVVCAAVGAAIISFVVLGAIFLMIRWTLGTRRDLVSIQEGARLVYEAAETNGALDLVTSRETPAGARLKHFVYVFMADDETQFFGTRPPSTQLLPIPRDELSELTPVDGEDRFDHLMPNRVEYINVKVRRSDLRRVMRAYPIRAREHARMLGFSRLVSRNSNSAT